MELECLNYQVRQPLATITLNRPAVLNAMNARMWQELSRALTSAADDDRVKVLIITGQGRAFSSGADLKESKTRGLSEYRKYLTRLQAVTRQLLHFDKPTIAAINGYALGSGYELALACDIRIAAAEAQIGSPEAKVVSSVTGGGLGPGTGFSWPWQSQRAFI
jgi:enoyl-CoA hydratase